MIKKKWYAYIAVRWVEENRCTNKRTDIIIFCPYAALCSLPLDVSILLHIVRCL